MEFIWEWELEAIIAAGNIARGIMPEGWRYDPWMFWWDGPGALRITQFDIYDLMGLTAPHRRA